MKIISQFKDYYDNAFGYDSDDSFLYLRKTELYTEPRLYTPESVTFKKETNKLWEILKTAPNISSYHARFSNILIGFCGKVYAGFADYGYSRTLDEHTISVKNPTLDDVVKYYKDILESKYPNYYDYRTAKQFFDFEDNKYSLTAVQNYIQKINGTSIGNDLFILVDAPIFLYWGGRIVKNPKLADNSVIKYIDPYTANQTVSQYMSSVLCVKDNYEPITVGGDEILARAKGFDEYSFRTLAPGQKKINRKLNRARKSKVIA